MASSFWLCGLGTGCVADVDVYKASARAHQLGDGVLRSQLKSCTARQQLLLSLPAAPAAAPVGCGGVMAPHPCCRCQIVRKLLLMYHLLPAAPLVTQTRQAAAAALVSMVRSPWTSSAR